MCFFRKRKSNAVKNEEDRALVESNAKSINSLIILCDSEEFCNKLKDIEEKLKYLTPSVSNEVYKFDKEIRDCIEELKLALAKSSTPNEKANSLLKQLTLLISDRNVNL